MTAKQFGDVVESRASRVRIARLLRGVVAVLPRGWIALRGLIRLSKARPERCESIGTIVEHWARARPDHPAIVYEGRYISYAEFNACANRWAACLRGLGIGKGASVGILMENRPELLTAVLAVVKLGWPAGMLNPRQRGAALAHSIRLIRAEVLLVGEECLEAFHSVKKEMPPALLSRTFWLAERSGERCPQDLGDFVAAAETNRECSNPPESGTIRGSDPAFYIFTSGTTGLPKASVRTHNCWMMSVAGIGMASLQMRRDDVLYCVLPFYHNTALTVAWSAVLAGGGTLAIARKFSASSFWDEIRAANATVFCYVGELCRYLLARPPSAKDRAHRIRVCVGNGLRPELWAAFRDRFGIGRINEFYGTSEHCLAFTNAFNIEGSCGFCPLPFAIVEYDIERDRPRRNAKGRLTRIVKGEVGLLLAEITQRTPFDGYTDAAESEK
ncbi:MAG: AMP-binding protein, partial [Gammaproteobacteria bacterium]